MNDTLTRVKPDCSVDTCDREGKGGRGYCYAHYKRWQEGRPMTEPLKKLVKGGIPCEVPECEKTANSHGLCPTHARRRDAGTDLNAPVRSYIVTEGTPPLLLPSR